MRKKQRTYTRNNNHSFNPNMDKLTTIALSIACFIIGLGAFTWFINYIPPAKDLPIPVSATDLPGQNYEHVKNLFRDADFWYVETREIKDLTDADAAKTGQVEDVSIAGRTDFVKGETAKDDAMILIRYHGVEDGEPTEYEASHDGINVNNSVKFKEMLTSTVTNDPSYGAFAAEHKYDLLEFDAHVVKLTKHKGTPGHYDVIVRYGNVDMEPKTGPHFKCIDIEPRDLGFYDGTMEQNLSEGDNVHVKMNIREYDSFDGVFLTDPIRFSLR